MKKKLAGVLAAIMVLSMASTTAFAAESPSGDDILPEQLEESIEGIESSDGTKISYEKVDADVVTEANKEAKDKAESGELLGLVNVSAGGKDVSKGITLTFKVPGVHAGDNIRILHKLKSGKWEVIVPVVGEGYVKATFYSLSPVAIVKYDAEDVVPSTQVVPKDDKDSGDKDKKDKKDKKKKSSSKSKSNSSTSPKTGSSMPVYPAIAALALIGIVACRKKARSL